LSALPPSEFRQLGFTRHCPFIDGQWGPPGTTTFNPTEFQRVPFEHYAACLPRGGADVVEFYLFDNGDDQQEAADVLDGLQNRYYYLAVPNYEELPGLIVTGSEFSELRRIKLRILDYLGEH
jgi:hypothetical protein